MYKEDEEVISMFSLVNGAAVQANDSRVVSTRLDGLLTWYWSKCKTAKPPTSFLRHSLHSQICYSSTMTSTVIISST
ncbi:hypothetical protein VTO42DRAFT_1190 [Malbranchea cinnamomea]